jgi:hypothetical protein
MDFKGLSKLPFWEKENANRILRIIATDILEKAERRYFGR